MRVFFSKEDYRRYGQILTTMARRYELAVWAYCLMPNHVHLIVVPSSETRLARPIGEAHRRYALEINRREGWTGHLWQERFASFPMDEAHLHAAVRYVLFNPVSAGLVEHPTDWEHSSVRAHLSADSDLLVDTRPLNRRIEDWTGLLDAQPSDSDAKSFRRHSSTGRPLGSDAFIKRLENSLKRRLRKRPPGPAPRSSVGR